jgi:hypothetical protein
MSNGHSRSLMETSTATQASAKTNRIEKCSSIGELFDLRLVRTRVDLREQVASVHVLSFLEVDADDLSLDLGAHDVRVKGDDGADTGQVDRYVVLGDHPRDDLRA